MGSPAWPKPASPSRREKGINPAKVTQIKAALELGRRLLVASLQEWPQVRSPADAANLLMMEMSLLAQEQMRVIPLDSKNRPGHPHRLPGLPQRQPRPRGRAVSPGHPPELRAFIVMRNHPDGDPTPPTS